MTPDERIVFIGYSKGATDVLEALARYPEVTNRTAAVATLAGVVSGTPIADDLPEVLKNFADQMFQGKCLPGEGRAFESLSRKERLAWLSANRLPSSVRYYSLAAFTDRENISLLLRPSYDNLSLNDPLNDGQVIFHDALVPEGALLGYLNADHWAVAVPFNRDHPTLARVFITRNSFPREVLLEAIARLLVSTACAFLSCPRRRASSLPRAVCLRGKDRRIARELIGRGRDASYPAPCLRQTRMHRSLEPAHNLQEMF